VVLTGDHFLQVVCGNGAGQPKPKWEGHVLRKNRTRLTRTLFKRTLLKTLLAGLVRQRDGGVIRHASAATAVRHMQLSR